MKGLNPDRENIRSPGNQWVGDFSTRSQQLVQGDGLRDFFDETRVTSTDRVFTIVAVQCVVMTHVVINIINSPALMKWADETVPGVTWWTFFVSYVLLFSIGKLSWSSAALALFTSSLGVIASRIPSYYFLEAVWTSLGITAISFTLIAAWAFSTEINVTQWRRPLLASFVILSVSIRYQFDSEEIPWLLSNFVHGFLVVILLMLLAAEVQGLEVGAAAGTGYVEEIRSAAIISLFIVMFFNLTMISFFSKFKKI